MFPFPLSPTPSSRPFTNEVSAPSPGVGRLSTVAIGQWVAPFLPGGPRAEQRSEGGTGPTFTQCLWHDAPAERAQLMLGFMTNMGWPGLALGVSLNLSHAESCVNSSRRRWVRGEKKRKQMEDSQMEDSQHGAKAARMLNIAPTGSPATLPGSPTDTAKTPVIGDKAYFFDPEFDLNSAFLD
jgi:hypothetical protein